MSPDYPQCRLLLEQRGTDCIFPTDPSRFGNLCNSSKIHHHYQNSNQCFPSLRREYIAIQQIHLTMLHSILLHSPKDFGFLWAVSHLRIIRNRCWTKQNITIHFLYYEKLQWSMYTWSVRSFDLRLQYFGDGVRMTSYQPNIHSGFCYIWICFYWASFHRLPPVYKDIEIFITYI